MKFGMGMDLDAIEVDLEGQGHRSTNKVTRVKKHDFRALCIDCRSKFTRPKIISC